MVPSRVFCFLFSSQANTSYQSDAKLISLEKPIKGLFTEILGKQPRLAVVISIRNGYTLGFHIWS